MAAPSRNTKIVATLGPATRSPEGIASLIAAGADVLRLNFSHGSRDEHAAEVERVRAASAQAGRLVAILQDLGGPKIRTGKLKGGGPIELVVGEPLRIVTGDEPGEPGRISTTYAGLAASVKPGDTLLLDDGRIELKVERSDGRAIETRVVAGGPLGENKGISAPGVKLPSAALTPKDHEDLAFGVRLGVDFVALSFVRSADDIEQARAAATKAGAPDLPIVAKIERPEALDDLDDIMSTTNAVMVARGDLGLEMPLEKVPGVQRRIIALGRARGVPVIVATQVLESMTTEPRPTRAEVSDAANAASDSVDAIMLSGETAIGAYPARAITTLDAIIREAEQIPREAAGPNGTSWFAGADRRIKATLRAPTHNAALCEAAVTLALRSGAEAIVAPTRTGHTARMLSALRPDIPIIAATPDERVARRLLLHRGVSPAIIDHDPESDPRGIRIEHSLVERGVVHSGSVVVFVNAHPDLDRPTANFLSIRRAGS